MADTSPTGSVTGIASEDERLLRFAAGDTSEEAFEAALPDLARLVRGYLSFARVGKDHLEDLAQEAIVRIYVWRNRRHGRDVASLRAWLRTICRNLVLDARPRPEAPPAVERSERPHERWDLREALEACQARLREPDRTVFRLRHVGDLDTKEIAELFGWKVRNCEHVLARARETLKRHLRREGYEP